ncbi:MAG: hypothetical protein R3C68_08750 [Myxococcota bacterium]
MCLFLCAPILLGATADVSRWRAPMVQDGLLGISSTEPLRPLDFTGAFLMSYASSPVVWRFPDDTFEPVVEHQLNADLVFGVGLVPFVDFALALPMTLRQIGPTDPIFGDLSATSVGDIRLMPRLQLADEETFGVGAALVAELTLPTGDNARFTGDRTVSWRPRVIGSLPLGRGKILGSLGYTLRRNSRIADVHITDEFDFHLGVPSTLRRPAPLSR